VAIHPTAIIDSRAQVHATVEVGPYAVIDGDVVVGEQCRLGPYVHLTGGTTIGARNDIGTGCVLGGPPQDLRFSGGITRLRIGNDNIFREHVTVHCANRVDEETRLGSGCLFMAHCHVGHNTVVGDGVIIANGAQLGGHVVVGDRAFISGNCLVHQFARVGMLALMQGGSAISKDLAPFCVSRGDNNVCGLNVVGLRRAGLGVEVRLELRRLYRVLFRSGNSRPSALEAASAVVQSPWGRELVEFVRTTRRGVITERGRGDLELDEAAHEPTTHSGRESPSSVGP
jgi:UDP-N-acetylglucosamine acyltransferase